MRRIFYSRFGGPRFCSLNTRPFPSGPGQIRVRVAGCGVNPIDFKTRSGLVLCPKPSASVFILCPVMMSAAWWTP